MFLVPEARSVLVIGHGSGITAGSVLRHPVERADLVEISSAVLKLDKVFQDFNYHVLDDPRVHVYEDDGLSFLRTVPRRYDVMPESLWDSNACIWCRKKPTIFATSSRFYSRLPIE